MGNKKRNKKNKITYVIGFLVIVAVCILGIPTICYFVTQNVGSGDFIYVDREGDMDNLEKKDVVIVPGALTANGRPLAIGTDRLNAAIDVYEQGAAELIIVSGGSTEEVETMARFLFDKGVPREDIAIDEQGVDTYESLTRTAQKYNPKSIYFCTQELYAGRARYLMNAAGIDGQVICVDTMYYLTGGKNRVREFFAATKAVYEGIFYSGKAKTSIEEKDFGIVPEFEETQQDDTHIDIGSIDTPKDCIVTDANPDDDYDVVKAVEYARRYALEANPKYPLFEQNCTNFVSQCLLEGGIKPDGDGKVSDSKKYTIEENASQWFSYSKISEKTGRIHYNTSLDFVNTDRFINYFSKKRGYEYTIYENDYEGKLECYNELACGDVLIFYGEDGGVVHVGLITGIGDMNAYYCGNTNAKKDYSVFTMNDRVYSKMGVLHMSGK